MFAADRVLQRNHGPDVLRGGRLERRIPGELDDYKFVDDTGLHGRTDVELCDGPERSRRDQRDRDRQPIVERRYEHLLHDFGARVGQPPEVQCLRRNCESLLCGEVDPVGVELRVLPGSPVFPDPASSLRESQSTILAQYCATL